MKKSRLLVQLAIAGITTGLVAAAPAKKHKKAKKPATDSSVVFATEKHSCKGLNSCKGKGNCATTQAELEARVKKMGISMDKAGKAHSCKGKNECKGLGGCAST